jgi:arsenite oxidase small subunit
MRQGVLAFAETTPWKGKLLAEHEDSREPAKEPITRRRFIQIGSVAASSALTGALRPAGAADTAAAKALPVVTIAELAAIRVDTPILFNYPDASSPAVLVRLKSAAPGGVGPGNSIVAYSSLCTHKGCPVAFKADRGLLVCPCHWSTFDPAKSGEMVIGQGSEALPQIALRVQGTAVQAVGVDGLIYGRHTNVL